MSTEERHDLTEVAIRAAREAGAIALRGFRTPGLRAEVKTDIHDLVTEYDRACERHIREIVLEAYPDAAIVGEEDGERLGTGPLTWYIDPIDGTANFARGIAMWAVSIAVARDGDIVSGVVYDPVADHLFWADDRGAFLGDAPLRCEGSTEPGGATVALNFPLPRDLVHLPELALEQFAEVTRQFAQVRGLGSTCIALCWVAAGWIDVTLSFETHPWDVAAAAFIVRRAGGRYISYQDGEALPERRDYLGPHYYAEVPGGEFEILHRIMRTQSARPLRQP